MKKLLVAFLFIAGLTWLLLARNSGPSVEEVRRIGIQAFIDHEILTSCTFSVLDDAKFVSCKPQDNSTYSTELRYSSNGRLVDRINRSVGLVTGQTYIKYDDNNGPFIVEKQSEAFQSLVVFRVCREKLVTDTLLRYQCEQYAEDGTLENEPVIYQYSAHTGELVVKEVFEGYGVVDQRFFYNRQGQLLAYQQYGVRPKTLSLHLEYGKFYRYEYHADRVLESYASARDPRSVFARVRDRILPSSLPSDSSFDSYHDVVFIKILQRDQRNTPHILLRPNEWVKHSKKFGYDETRFVKEQRHLAYQ